METSDFAGLVAKIYQSKRELFTAAALRDMAGEPPQATFFSMLKRLTARNILQKLERDKYRLVGGHVHDFRLANFLYEPSYVSLETALNFYGVLSQFPYEIASATPKKTAVKTIDGKTFRYFRLQKPLFWGYELAGGFLIAQPEKALLDLLYLASKGLAVARADELDLSKLNKTRFKSYLKRFPPMKTGGIF